jgi:predicted nucleic acid-binding protein
MRYVIDCSVAAKWEVNEIDSTKALRLRDDFRSNVVELLAPDIVPIEVANALYSAELRGAILPGQFYNHLINILGRGPVLYQSTSLLPRAAVIVRQATIRVGIDDCLYVALAEREGCELVTADQKLLRALGSVHPFITSLASLP